MGKIISFTAVITFLLLFYPQTESSAEQLIKLELGRVASGTIVERTLVIQRSIRNIVITCECTEVKALSKPNQSPTTLDIKFDSRGYKGKISQDIILVDSEENIITLRLSADVE